MNIVVQKVMNVVIRGIAVASSELALIVFDRNNDLHSDNCPKWNKSFACNIIVLSSHHDHSRLHNQDPSSWVLPSSTPTYLHVVCNSSDAILIPPKNNDWATWEKICIRWKILAHRCKYQSNFDCSTNEQKVIHNFLIFVEGFFQERRLTCTLCTSSWAWKWCD